MADTVYRYNGSDPSQVDMILSEPTIVTVSRSTARNDSRVEVEVEPDRLAQDGEG